MRVIDFYRLATTHFSPRHVESSRPLHMTVNGRWALISTQRLTQRVISATAALRFFAVLRRDETLFVRQ